MTIFRRSISLAGGLSFADTGGKHALKRESSEVTVALLATPSLFQSISARDISVNMLKLCLNFELLERLPVAGVPFFYP